VRRRAARGSRARPVAVAALVALAVLATGCGAAGTGDKGYVSGDGVVRQLPAHDRKPVGTVSGPTLDGGTFDLADHRGKVVVVNVWGSWCGDCRAEAATLVAAAKELTAKGVVFVGINTRDASKDGPRAYERAHGIHYPSIFDPSGENLLAFRGVITPNSIPSTIVIDPQGRVAASVNGQLTSATTLVELAEDAGATA
jgi:thiol-disulfide isomerase/thioredoxin